MYLPVADSPVSVAGDPVVISEGIVTLLSVQCDIATQIIAAAIMDL